MISGLESLHLRLADFEGPLPLLLHLIEKNELEVTRVSVVAVADQFLALVASLGPTSLSTTGEFVAAAARLLLIKSRALLFRPDESPTETDEPDDAELLARQIAEYARFKGAASHLAARLQGEELTRPRLPAPAGPPCAAPPPAASAAALHRAARRLLCAPRTREAEPDPWPDVKYGAIRTELLADVQRLGSTTFSTLCKNARHPLVVITMFLALLDAVRMEQLEMCQAVAFGPISIAVPVSSARRA